MGTSVVSGTGKGIVRRTGSRTLLGKLAVALSKKRPPTAFEIGIRRVSYMFMSVMVIMVPVVLVISGFTQGNWFQAFLFAIAVAVGLTPEMLPMIVNACLAKGAHTMSKKETIVKQLASIINFGAMNILWYVEILLFVLFLLVFFFNFAFFFLLLSQY